MMALKPNLSSQEWTKTRYLSIAPKSRIIPIRVAVIYCNGYRAHASLHLLLVTGFELFEEWAIFKVFEENIQRLLRKNFLLKHFNIALVFHENQQKKDRSPAVIAAVLAEVL